MIRLALCLLLLTGCTPDDAAQDFRDAIACEFALASLDGSPSPAPSPEYDCPTCKDTGVITHGDGHQTACPDCSDGALPEGRDGLIQGIRDIGPMIQKAKPILEWAARTQQAAERDGEIVVKVQIPKSAPMAAEVPVEAVVEPSENANCVSGSCSTARQGLFGRIRRR